MSIPNVARNSDGSVYENQEAVALTLTASKVASVSSSDIPTYGYHGVMVCTNLTFPVGSAPSIVISVEAKDGIAGTYTALLSSAAITTTVSSWLTVYPGITAVANQKASQGLPKNIRITYTNAADSAVTATIGYNLLK